MRTIVGVAWYDASAWDRLRTIAPDAAKLETTHAEWLAFAAKSLDDLRAEGYRPYRIRVKLAALQAWCDETGRSPDASARAEYASAELRRLHEAGLLDPDA